MVNDQPPIGTLKEARKLLVGQRRRTPMTCIEGFEPRIGEELLDDGDVARVDVLALAAFISLPQPRLSIGQRFSL